MKEMIRFRIHSTAGGNKETTEFRAASESDARDAFNGCKVPGVCIVSIE